MARLTKDAWAKSTLKTKEIEVSELDGTVLIRELPASFVAEINQHIKLTQVGREQTSSIDLQVMERQKFAYGVIGDDLQPLFTEQEAGELATKHGRAFQRVLSEIDKLSEITEEGVDAAEARFQGSGVRKNGGPVSDPAPAGDGRPDVRPRAGA